MKKKTADNMRGFFLNALKDKCWIFWRKQKRSYVSTRGYLNDSYLLKVSKVVHLGPISEFT